MHSCRAPTGRTITSRTDATGLVPNTTAIVVDETNRMQSATIGAETET